MINEEILARANSSYTSAFDWKDQTDSDKEEYLRCARAQLKALEEAGREIIDLDKLFPEQLSAGSRMKYINTLLKWSKIR